MHRRDLLSAGLGLSALSVVADAGAEKSDCGVETADIETTEWVRRRFTEQPLQTVAQPIQLQNGDTDGLPRSFILTTPEKYLREWQRSKLEVVRADPSWDYHESLIVHDAMIIAPCETSELLDEIFHSSSA